MRLSHKYPTATGSALFKALSGLLRSWVLEFAVRAPRRDTESLASMV
jgi:hypothetical protein